MQRTCRQCGINLGTGSGETYREGPGASWFECFPCAIEDPGYRASLRSRFSYEDRVYAR